MSAESRVSEALIEKIGSLPIERIAEVENFVDFIRSRDQEREPVARVRAEVTPKRPLDVERLAAFRARMPPSAEDSATAIRRMRDEERY